MPHFDAAQASNENCAAACAEMGLGSVVYSGMQAGYACFCGTAADADKTVKDSNKASFSQCSDPCTQYHESGGSPTKTPAGIAGETCGGPWLNQIIKIDCTWRFWGWKFLVIFTLCTGVYVGVGAYGPARAKGAKKTNEIIAAHPHFGQWLEILQLTKDGLEFTKARASGRPPSVAQRQAVDRSNASKQGTRVGDVVPKNKKTKSEKQAKRAKRLIEPHTNSDISEPQKSVVADSVTQSASVVVGTSAGGGGRWIHVPN